MAEPLKREFCKNESRGLVLHVPLCLNCMLHIRLILDKLVGAVKEDNLRADDRREVEEVEKRYTSGVAVRGSD